MNLLTRQSRTFGFSAGLLLCAAIATTPAMADSVPITFQFTGAVTKVGHHLSGGSISLGQSVTGSYTFNPNTVNTGSGSTGEYDGALNGPSTNLNITIGAPVTYVASLGSGDNGIEVENPYGLKNDSYEVEGRFSGSAVNWHNPKHFELELEHPDSNQFNGVLLPLTPPSVSAFDKATLRLIFEDGGKYNTITIKLDTLSAVPLPPAVILFGAGLVALIGLGARSRWRDARARQA